MSARNDMLLEGMSRDTRIIEIGPSFNPIAPKAGGWKSFSLDHTTREGLADKYASHTGVDVAKIEDVDFVWTDGSLTNAVPPAQHGTFDAFLASHVIEHTPDLIAFLDAAETLLRPDGVVVLAVPDKRYCFDFFQQITTTGQVLEAHLTRRTRHSRERAFDHHAYAVADGGSQAWGQRPSQGLRLIEKLDTAAVWAQVYDDSTEYHDLHAWHFVPSSFELLMLELGRLGKTDWRIERMGAPGGWEFFSWLRRGASDHVRSIPADAFESLRLVLLKRTLIEMQGQIDWLLESQPSLMEGQIGLTPWTSLISHLPGALERPVSRQEVNALRDRVAELEAHKMEALERIAAFEGSTSWRLTAPLRKLSVLLNRRQN